MWRLIYIVHRMWVKFKFWFSVKQLAAANRTVIKYPKRHAECWWNCVVAKQIKFRQRSVHLHVSQPQQSSINTVLRQLEMQMSTSGVFFPEISEFSQQHVYQWTCCLSFSSTQQRTTNVGEAKQLCCQQVHFEMHFNKMHFNGKRTVKKLIVTKNQAQGPWLELPLLWPLSNDHWVTICKEMFIPPNYSW